MRIVWQGADIPSNRTLLSGMGVNVFGVGYKSLAERVKETEANDLLRNFPEGAEVHLYPGVGGNLTIGEHEELAKRYEKFIEDNCGSLASWTEYDSMELGPEWIRGRRRDFYESFDDTCFRPVWKPELGMSVLTHLSATYPDVVIPRVAIEEQPGLLGTLRILSGRHETRYHLMAAKLLDQNQARPFATIYTITWTAPMRLGSTILWRDGSLHHHPALVKEQVRMDNRNMIESTGLNYQAILDDKPSEVSKLAIWSLQQFEEACASGVVLSLVPGSTASHQENTGAEGGVGASDTFSGESRNFQPHVPALRESSERSVLPSVSVGISPSYTKDEHGNNVYQDVSVVKSNSGTVRSCDTCFVNATCPAMRPGHECSFHLPVEIKTRDQVISLMQAMMEMQTARVAFARYAEELNGGYPDQTVSKEMDRLFSLIRTTKKMEEDNSFVKMTVEAKGSAGILSSIFGKAAGEAIAQPAIDTGSISPE